MQFPSVGQYSVLIGSIVVAISHIHYSQNMNPILLLFYREAIFRPACHIASPHLQQNSSAKIMSGHGYTARVRKMAGRMAGQLKGKVCSDFAGSKNLSDNWMDYWSRLCEVKPSL